MVKYILIVLGLMACEPKVITIDRGYIEQSCNLDGSCNGSILQCKTAKLYLGIPVDIPRCLPK